jgi:hypothetical protein
MTPSPTAPADSVHPDPSKIIVPRRHGQVLVEPPFSVLENALRSRPLLDATEFASTSLTQLRKKARAHFLQAATTWAALIQSPPPRADALESPWVITGHQLEFYHAGVWVKVLAADELAKRVPGAVAFDLLVDHDIVDERGFDVPARRDETVGGGGGWERRKVEFAPSNALPAEALHAPDNDTFEHWDAAVARHPQSHTDTLAMFMSALRAPAKRPYPQWLSQARAQVEHAFNIHVHHVPTSLACAGETWNFFIRAWVTHAAEWTALYNRHLAAYRSRQGIKNTQHPMPDLTRTPTQWELPFWIYRLGEPRQRLTIRQTPAGPVFLHDNAELPIDAVLAGHENLVIRPRALALTLFIRLFLADVFIHGIGGALYDQITDGLLADLTHTATPPYGCVSAAWLLPLGRPLEDADDIAALRWRRHHAAHNPQLVIDPFTALKTDVAELIRDRRHLIEKIATSLTTHRKDPDARRDRRTWFDDLHRINTELHKKAPRLLTNLDHQLQEAQQKREQNKVLLWREYFFALHSTDSLQKLITTLHTL